MTSTRECCFCTACDIIVQVHMFSPKLLPIKLYPVLGLYKQVAALCWRCPFADMPFRSLLYKNSLDDRCLHKSSENSPLIFADAWGDEAAELFIRMVCPLLNAIWLSSVSTAHLIFSPVRSFWIHLPCRRISARLLPGITSLHYDGFLLLAVEADISLVGKSVKVLPIGFIWNLQKLFSIFAVRKIRFTSGSMEVLRLF